MSVARPEFRIATLDDAQQVHAFARRTFVSAFAADNTDADMQSYLGQSMLLEQQAAAIEDPTGRVILMEQGADLIAYASLRDRHAPECVTSCAAIELHRFYVDAPWHGTHIARDLMQRVLAQARSLGASTLWLGVWENNPRAIRFYQKQGFVDVGSIDFLLGTAAQTDRVMQVTLPSGDLPVSDD
ncbi:MAG: GNAT family N-acetyltransferase [Pseudomonadota bacterium]